MIGRVLDVEVEGFGNLQLLPEPGTEQAKYALQLNTILSNLRCFEWDGVPEFFVNSAQNKPYANKGLH